ncbi:MULTISPECIES: hypothetical protein [Pseudomonas]|uniref:hypothetical protein n=1 Tax=Pseudomonas TaxID=286 RepID=UPI001CEF8D75|nr:MULTISPECIES: hypothetical protein [Pseudomonas]
MGVWLDDDAIGDNPLVIERTEHPDLSVDMADIYEFGLRFNHCPTAKIPGVFPFVFRDVQSFEIAGFSQSWAQGIAQSKNVVSATSINRPAERTLCGDVDQIVGLSQFHAAFAGGGDSVMLGICSFFEGLETLLKNSRRGSFGN